MKFLLIGRYKLEWNVEDDRKWVTEDTDKYFYGIELRKRKMI